MAESIFVALCGANLPNFMSEPSSLNLSPFQLQCGVWLVGWAFTLFSSFGNEASFFPGTFEVRNNEIGRLRYFDNLRTMRNLILKNTSNAINVERSKYLFKCILAKSLTCSALNCFCKKQVIERSPVLHLRQMNQVSINQNQKSTLIFMMSMSIRSQLLITLLALSSNCELM